MTILQTIYQYPDIEDKMTTIATTGERLVKRITTKAFRAYCIDRFPILITRKAYRRFFQYLCFSASYCKSRNELLIPHGILKDIAGDSEEWNKNGQFSGIAFLTAFKAEILPKLQWREYEPFVEGQWIGNARTIIRFGFDAELEFRIQQELEDLDSTDLVHFVDGHSFYPKTRSEQIAEDQANYEAHIETQTLNSVQQEIVNYMNRVPAVGLLKKLNANRKQIFAAIEAIDNQRSKLTQYKILHAIKENPHIYYQPSKHGRTARLFHSSECAIGLKKSVRHALCAGWWDLDLVSSQLAILAEIINAPITLAFLSSGKEIWSHLEETIFGSATVDSSHKKAFKAIIYGICFGRTKKEIKKELLTLGMTDFKKLFDNPIIAELFERRNAWFDAIEKHGYVTDAWGGEIRVSQDRWLGAVAAAKIQSIELDIISAIFPVAERYKNVCQITLFQHDGVTISFFDHTKREKIIREMNKAIAIKAQTYSVVTRLAAEELKGPQ